MAPDVSLRFAPLDAVDEMADERRDQQRARVRLADPAGALSRWIAARLAA